MGMAVDNTAEIFTTINVTLSVKDAFEQLQGILNKLLSNSHAIDGNNSSITE
jgi:hypothetical protein